MRRGLLPGACLSFALLAQAHAQQVEIPRDTPRQIAARPSLIPVEDEEEIAAEPLRLPPRNEESVASKITVEQMRKAGALAREKIEKETRLTTSYLADLPKSAMKSLEPAIRPSLDRQLHFPDPALSQPINLQMESALTKLADG